MNDDSNKAAVKRRSQAAGSELSGWEALKLAVDGGDKTNAWMTGKWQRDGEKITFRLLVPSKDSDGGHRLNITVTPNDLDVDFYSPNDELRRADATSPNPKDSELQ